MLKSALAAATALPLAALVAAPMPVLAQAAPAAADPHDHVPSDIIVTGSVSRSRQDVLSGVAVVQGAALDQAIRTSIGETLDKTPGVSATSFGPTASRPVLRGLQGERVRVLSDGIGSIDVSNTSVDHAAVVNPLLAERIEVLRGPQSLLYGLTSRSMSAPSLPMVRPPTNVHLPARSKCRWAMASSPMPTAAGPNPTI